MNRDQLIGMVSYYIAENLGIRDPAVCLKAASGIVDLVAATNPLASASLTSAQQQITSLQNQLASAKASATTANPSATTAGGGT